MTESNHTEISPFHPEQLLSDEYTFKIPNHTKSSKHLPALDPEKLKMQCRDGASHQCGPGAIPRSGVKCGLSLLVLYSALRGFL